MLLLSVKNDIILIYKTNKIRGCNLKYIYMKGRGLKWKQLKLQDQIEFWPKLEKWDETNQSECTKINFKQS